MVDVIVGIMLAVLGLVICFAGLRVFLLALPALGFISGVFIGAAGVRAIFGDGFFSTATGVIVGLFVGLILAVLSYLFWYVGALIAAGSTGALIGSGLMNFLGATRGWVVFIGAALGAIIVFIIAFRLALPVYVVIVNTAFVGASAIIGGVMLMFNQIDRADLGYGVVWAAIEESWFWIIVWVVLAAVGIGSQLRTIAQVTLPEDRWASANPHAGATA
ncbi:MAG: hypothetical protein DCC58_05890 [Chloroflexi bacterium]|nr:MAG: hypothetical protein DCC58_05890 [Chloroflexota bacterium]